MSTSASEQVEVVGISDLRVGKAPLRIETNLGSCIAVCLYCIKTRAGGLLHVMMPHVDEANFKGELRKAKYANTGIPELLRQLHAHYGVNPADVHAKIFGGGKVLKNITTNIGEQNETAVRNVLQELGIRIIAAKTGGEKGYRVSLDLESGKVRCQLFGEKPEEY